MTDLAPTSPCKEENHNWKILELLVLVILSLSLQFVLIATGNRRKYTRNNLFRAILWLSYLSADSVATLALGVLSKGSGYSRSEYTITAFWAPFLLMHLGGPDTITAYAMADNELWLRHFLGLISQAAVVVYVFIRSFKWVEVDFLSLVIFSAGVVKYGERSWVLYSSSKDRYSSLLVSKPDPGPDYAKFMDELVSEEREGYKVVSLVKVVDNVSSSLVDLKRNVDGKIPDDLLLQKAYSFFGTFKKLFADLILSFQDRERSLSFFKKLKWEEAFNMVEIELGLVFDLFYTKSFFIFSKKGVILRIFSCSATIAALVAFITIKKNDYSEMEAEVIVTYILLGGALSLELYAAIILCASDRMMIKMESRERPKSNTRNFVSVLQRIRIVPARKRWSNSMGQYNVLDHCLKYMPKRDELHWYHLDQYLVKLEQYLVKNFCWRSVSVPDQLKEMIFHALKTRAEVDGEKSSKSYWKDRILLEEMALLDKDGNVLFDEVLFDQSVLLWHMATDICYYSDMDTVPGLGEDVIAKRGRCRLLSNYMVHLLITHPFMLPSGIGLIRFQDTCAEATEFFKHEEMSSGKNACALLCKVEARYKPSAVKGDRSKSLLFDAVMISKYLNGLEASRRWDMISRALLDVLTFAASKCSWSYHAEKLSQGGELLTHVWLLMAHFGMTDQFQISQGYIRAKLDWK